MLQESYLRRFSGIGRLYGMKALEYLSGAYIIVVGLGGVGSWVVEALARSGINHLLVIDLDEICITNTNRQIHAIEGNIGKNKAITLQKRVALINPNCQVVAIEDFMTEDNVSEYIVKNCDFVVDCIDDAKVKSSILNYSKRNKIPIITVGGVGGKVDATKLQIKDLSQSYQDPLLAKTKQNLKKRYGWKNKKFGIPCVFSSEQLRYPINDGVCFSKGALQGVSSMDCSNGFGAITHMTGTAGFFVVNYVINKMISKTNNSSS